MLCLLKRDMSIKGQLTYFAHLYKALFRQHHRHFFETTLAPLLPHDGIVIDVGGHAGQYTKLFSHHTLQGGYVFVFEPGDYALSILRRVKSFKSLKNIDIIPMALSHKKQMLTLKTPIKKSGSLGFGLSFTGDNTDERNIKTQHVQATTLDDFAKEHDLKRIDFIKIDIEGGEYDFLKGARNALKTYQPRIWMEINQKALARHNVSPKDIEDFMSELNYAPYQKDDNFQNRLQDPISSGDILWQPLAQH